MDEEDSDSEGVEQADTEIANVNDSENLSTGEIKTDNNTDSCEVKSEDVSQSNAKTGVVKKDETEQQQQQQQESVSKPVICSVCNQEFESRNRLFEHIKEEGHAAPKTASKKATDAKDANPKANRKNKKLKK
jgi:DnaJ family protein A protein 5